MNMLEGYAYYTRIQEPVDCYTVEKGQEWKVTMCVDEDTFDTYEETYDKPSMKKIKTENFEAEYKTPAPEEFAGNKYQYMITLRMNTKLGNGAPVPDVYAPKVLMRKGKAVVDVTHDLLVGNGSKAKCSITAYEQTTGKYAGLYPRLKNMLVEELVEYIPEEKAPLNVDPVFGEFESDAIPTAKEFEKEDASDKPAAKPAKARKAKAVVEDDDADPFA